MAPKSQKQIDHERLLERLQLCSLVVQEVHLHLEKPNDPEQKADILLAVEDLTGEILDLLKTTKLYVWGSDELLS
jgi:hypothetical protein